METILAFVIGGLYAASFYMMLRRSLAKLILGLMLFGHAVHLLIFTSAGLTDGNAAFIAEGAEAPVPPYSDPLPQALILTAIVISFGMLAFSLALVRRTQKTMATDDMDEMTEDTP